MRYLLSLLGTTSLLFLSACSEDTNSSSGNIEAPVSIARPAADQISESEAAARKARVSNISYTLDIDLISDPDAYQGVVEVQFELSDNNLPLDIDFTGGSVASIVANGTSVPVDYNGFYILVPASALESGQNTVEVNYSHPFDQDGTGLHRFVDPEDGNTYLYTYLWPYYSNRLFPNFDQPDLKGSYEMTVLAQEDWHVVSAMTEDAVTNTAQGKSWHFPRSEVFSSYIFSLHAGPYQVWEDMAGDVPIRLMARQSLAEYVAVDEWMAYTKGGLSHYRDYFDIPYPFVKYDQVIVPDFLIGAMENVAAVTFAESYVDRGASNRFSSQRRAGTILHEMAHMWFGDLVTMRWWNGLWLNESFATLMSSIATYESTEFTDLWHDFYLSENLTAISADNAVSTHPIEVQVASSNDFFNVFDAITYDKGASVLNQLSHYIGRENFRLGVSNYLKEHSWGNTDLADFMTALSNQSGIDLGPWADDWMYQAGVNTLEARFSCDAGVIERFALLQTAPSDHSTLRNQRIQLGLFETSSAAGPSLYANLEVEVRGAETQVPAAVGLACPQLALPNYGGWGYSEIKLDDTSMATLENKDTLRQIEDPLLRSMFWTALYDAPANNQIDNATVLDMAISSLAWESNDRIGRQTLDGLIQKFNQLERLGDLGAQELAQYGPQAEAQLWELIAQGVLENTQSESLLTQRLNSYIAITRSPTALNNLITLLNGSTTLPGYDTGQGMRWSMIQRLTSRRHEQGIALLEAETILDPSDAGRRAAIAAEAGLPDLEVKQRWFNEVIASENPLPLSHLRAAMRSLFPTGQESFQETLLPQMTANLDQLAVSRDNYFLRSYGSDLFSGLCSADALNELRSATSNTENIGATLYRFMSENVQRAEQCVALKAN